MGCPIYARLGKKLVFAICTHNPETGVLTDADSLPLYRLYKAENATPILTGTMAKLDDTGTTGFYSEQISVTGGNGFTNAVTYTIYIQAVVNGRTGGIAYAFRAISGLVEVLVPSMVKSHDDSGYTYGNRDDGVASAVNNTGATFGGRDSGIVSATQSVSKVVEANR